MNEPSWIEKQHATNMRRVEQTIADRLKSSWAKEDEAAPVKLDPVVEANRALLHKRSQVGIAKYGTTLHDARLSERELIVHALQESLDLANYLQAQLQRHDRMADDGK